VQQWYGDASFSGFGFDYGGMAGASSSHPPPFDSPPLANLQNVEESEDEDDDDEIYQLNLKCLAILCSVLFCLEKSDCPILPSRIFIYLFTFL
jgi:hypothetical protein